MDLSAWNFDLAWVYYPSVAVFFGLCLIAWLTTLFTLPGNWLVVALAAGFAWLFPHEEGRGISWMAVGVSVGIAALGEVIEFAAGAAGAAKQGASRRAVLLALVGAMVGSILGVLVGTPVPILGSFIMALLGGAGGAFAGAYLGEMWKGRTVDERVAAGQGAFVGKISGTLGKLACGVIIIVIVMADALF